MSQHCFRLGFIHCAQASDEAAVTVLNTLLGLWMCAYDRMQGQWGVRIGLVEACQFLRASTALFQAQPRFFLGAVR